MLVERGLDLRGVHVGAADQDHVRLAVAEIDVALGVLAAEISERLPVARTRPGPGADVAVRRRRVLAPAHPDLADLARRKLSTVGIEDAHLAHERAPHRAAVLEPLAAGDDAERLRLGAAVELEDPIGTEPLDPRLLEPHGARRGHVEDHAQTREVVARALGLGQAPDAVHHRRHRVHPVDAMPLDEGQGERRVEARHHDDVVAAQQRQRGGRERAVVVERSAHQVHAVVGDAQQRREAGERLPGAGLGRHDELGASRAAAGGGGLERGADHRRQRIGRQRAIRLKADRHGGAARRLRADRRPRRARSPRGR